MLSRGLRIGLVVGIFLILIALGLHTVLRLYNAPEDVEFDLLNIFAATFASTVLTFFIGILVADYQIERDNARRIERLDALLEAELSDTLRELEHGTSITVHLSDGSTAEARISQVQALVLEEAIRSGFFEPPEAERAFRLLGRIRALDAKVSYLVPILSSGTGDPNHDEVARRAIRELEETRQEIADGIRSLKKRK